MFRIGAEPPFDFWTYVEGIPESDYEGYDCSEGAVEHVWRSEDGEYAHVLIKTKNDKDVFMVIVLALRERTVVGHRILDLKAKYGLRDQT